MVLKCSLSRPWSMWEQPSNTGQSSWLQAVRINALRIWQLIPIVLTDSSLKASFLQELRMEACLQAADPEEHNIDLCKSHGQDCSL